MKATVILLISAVAMPALGADIYECVYANGTLGFTNRTVPEGCKRLNLPQVPAVKVQPKDAKILQADKLNPATYALVDPDESVREPNKL